MSVHRGVQRSVLALLVIVLPTLFVVPACAADYNNRTEVRAFVAKMVREHGFNSRALTATLRAAKRQQIVIDTISRPAEHVLTWKEYRRIFITQARIDQGVTFWDANAKALARAQTQYGVSPEIVVAIIGVETSYGRNTGSFRVLDALTTLAFDYPPRSAFFKGELEQFLVLTQEQHIDPKSLLGSYAGAMGFAQFIPSSYRHFAVDFDGDGAKDLWRNPTDAIGSVANYFHEHDWQTGKPIVMQLTAPATALDAVASTDPEPKQRFSELVGKAFTGGAVSGDESVALFKLEGESGAEYWLGMHNFYVITRYNHSPLYALAVFQLANALMAEREVQAKAAQAVTSPAAAVESEPETSKPETSKLDVH